MYRIYLPNFQHFYIRTCEIKRFFISLFWSTFERKQPRWSHFLEIAEFCQWIKPADQKQKKKGLFHSLSKYNDDKQLKENDHLVFAIWVAKIFGQEIENL